MSFFVYRSSAGSGKTFTLVKAYLRIALSPRQVDAYRNILAITFTNKAAREMLERTHQLVGNQFGSLVSKCERTLPDAKRKQVESSEWVRVRSRDGKVDVHAGASSGCGSTNPKRPPSTFLH